MTDWLSHEAINTILAGAALAVAVFVAVRDHKLVKRQAELASRRLEEADKDKSKAHVSAKLIRDGAQFRVVLSNTSNSLARAVNVWFAEDAHDQQRSLFEGIDLIDKLPIDLDPGEDVRVTAVRTLSSPLAYDLELTWVNPDGSDGVRKQTITAP